MAEDDMSDWLEMLNPVVRPDPRPDYVAEMQARTTGHTAEEYLPEPEPVFITVEEQTQEILRLAPRATQEIVNGLGPMAEGVINLMRTPGLTDHRGIRLLRELLVGPVSTSDIRDRLGQVDAPRTASDLEEFGITLRRTAVRGVRHYELHPAAYRGLREARQALTTEERRALQESHTLNGVCLCLLCQTTQLGFGPGLSPLNADHRIPYRVAGNGEHRRIGLLAFMPVCGSCNTRKADHCEQCSNHHGEGSLDTCRSCWLHGPQNPDWEHVKMIPRSEADIDSLGFGQDR